MEKEQRERERRSKDRQNRVEKKKGRPLCSLLENAVGMAGPSFTTSDIYTPLDLRNTPLGLPGDKSESARVQWGRGEKRGIREGVREKKRGGRGERGTALSAPICGHVPALVPNAPARDRNYG